MVSNIIILLFQTKVNSCGRSFQRIGLRRYHLFREASPFESSASKYTSRLPPDYRVTQIVALLLADSAFVVSSLWLPIV